MPEKTAITSISGVPHKQCGRCRTARPLEEFNKCKYSASGFRSQCRSCMREQRRSLRSHYAEWRSKPAVRQAYREHSRREARKHPIRIWARNKARQLDREPCSVCGASRSEAHHPDYLKPLDVVWLCRTHHDEWHEINGPGLNADAPIPDIDQEEELPALFINNEETIEG